jgi:GTP diphosphokinase / guanosine-3',5'-bis(diphosphate) 3'-diphosphatase
MSKGELLSKAIHLATNAHHGQFDKGGNPYILHVLAVMNLLEDQLWVQGPDEELQAIALLHDVIEDTKTTFQDLKDAGFSDRVIDAVRLLTKMPGQTYEEYKAGVFSNLDAMRVKSADLTHNSDIRRLKGISERDTQRMARYHQFFLEIQSRLKNS